MDFDEFDKIQSKIDFESAHEEFDENFRRLTTAAVIWIVFCVIIAVAALCGGIWFVIHLVGMMDRVK
jgi:hypothetical protein